MSFIQTDSFGEPGGHPFKMQPINSIGLRTGNRVDSIIINDFQYGRSGGQPTEVLHFAEDEYISEIVGRSGGTIDQLHILTNKGRSIGGGGNGGDPTINLKNIRVIGIGGMAGKYVDILRIKYVKDYVESKVKETDATFILSYSPPGSDFVESKLQSEKTIEAYEKITRNMIRQTYSASVQGEYFGRVSASLSAAASLEMENMTMEKTSNQLEQLVEKMSTETQKIPNDKVGIKMVTAKIMEDGEKKQYWIFPTSEASYSIIELDNIKSISNCFDLTGTLYRQMSKPIPNQHKYGYLYYPNLDELGSKPRKIGLRAVNGKYVSADLGREGILIANRDQLDAWETFELINQGGNKIGLRAVNGKYVSADLGREGILIANRDQLDAWETFELINQGG